MNGAPEAPETPEAKAREQYRADLEWLGKQPQGRRLLNFWRVAAGVDGIVFDIAAPDPLRAALREGERRFVIRIWKELLEVAPKMATRSLNEFLDLSQEFHAGSDVTTKEK